VGRDRDEHAANGRNERAAKPQAQQEGQQRHQCSERGLRHDHAIHEALVGNAAQEGREEQRVSGGADRIGNRFIRAAIPGPGPGIDPVFPQVVRIGNVGCGVGPAGIQQPGVPDRGDLYPRRDAENRQQSEPMPMARLRGGSRIAQSMPSFFNL
jgi:hypothetical protein